MIFEELSKKLQVILNKWESTFRGAIDIYDFESEDEIIDTLIYICCQHIEDNDNVDIYKEFLQYLQG